MNKKQFVDMPEPLGLFAKSLFTRGCEYLDAFELLSAHDDKNMRFARYFLFSHSLELLLKAFLACKGVSKKALRERPLGHDLKALFALCKSHQMPTVNNLEYLVPHIQEMNQDYDFRYPSGYNLSVPKPSECIPIARELEKAIDKLVTGEQLKAELHIKADEHLTGKTLRWSD